MKHQDLMKKRFVFVALGSKPYNSLTVGEFLHHTFHTGDSLFILLSMWASYSLRESPPPRKSGRVTHPQSTDRVYKAFRLLESMGELLTHSQRTGFIQHFASYKVWASYSPTVNGQGLYSISPPRKYGRGTHPQSTDRVYTASRLLENMGELLTHSQRTRFIQHIAS